jgi:hypothetical protein
VNNNEYDFNDELFGEELETMVKHSIDYLLKEGIIVQVGDKFRLKTKKEIKKELDSILNS